MKILFLTVCLCISLNAKYSPNDLNNSNKINKEIIYDEEVLWDNANKLFKESKYEQAAKKFMEIEDLYPASDKIKEVIFLASKSFFLAKKYIKAIELAELSKELDFQYREKDINDILIKSYYMLLKRPERENKNIDLIINLSNKNTPKYAKIRQKCIDILAYSKLSTGLMYAKKDNYIVSLKYYGHVINNYPESNFTAEAYFRCAEIFCHLGLQNDKNACIKALSIKHKNSVWYNKAIQLGK